MTSPIPFAAYRKKHQPKYWMLLSDFIFEKTNQNVSQTAEMQLGYKMIARWLIDGWAMRIVKFIRLTQSQYGSGDIDPKSLPSRIVDLAVCSFSEIFGTRKHFNKLPKRLQDFLKQASKREMIIRPRAQVDETKGVFAYQGTQPVIVVYFDKEEFDDRQEYFADGNPHQVQEFLSTRTDTLVHELIHAYDDFASGGKYLDQNFWKDQPSYGDPPLSDQERVAKHERYLQYTHEINARFGQTVSQMYAPQFTNWRDFMWHFQENYQGWRLMPPEVKRRLLIRLGSIWTAEERKKTIDIKPFVEKLNNRLREIDPMIWINSSSGNIEIRDLDELPPKTQSLVLMQTTKLADIFQRQVVTSEDVPMLTGFGFVRNRGRNKDYRISSPFRRPANKRATTSA